MPVSEFSDVFVSYRRTDVEFAKKLVASLEATGKECWIDWEDIPPGSEGFSDDIKRGLEGTDAFLAILSPDYLASPYCVDMELNYAVQLKKKIIPVVLEKFDGHNIPSSIGHINWIYFVPHAGRANTFEEGLANVMKALDSDLSHARDHRKFGVRALEWESHDKHHSFLLSGDALQSAEKWLGDSGNKVPEPSDLHRQYILASEKRARDNGRKIIASISVAFVIMVILTILSLFAFGDASIQRASAEDNLLQAWEVQARFLMELSETQLQTGMPQTALLSGLESLNHYPEVFIPESYNLLYRTIASSVQEIAYMPHSDETTEVFGGVWNEDNSHILTWADDSTVHVWDLAGSSITLQHAADERVNGALWLGERVISWSADDTAKIWNATTGEMLLNLQHSSSVLGAQVSPDENRLVTWTLLGEVAIWNLADGSKIDSYQHTGQVRGALWAEDNATVFSWGEDGFLIVRATVALTSLQILDHRSAIEGASISPRGRYLMLWTLDGKVWIRDSQTEFSVLRRFAHERRVLGAMWSRDESKVLSWSEDSTARLWDVVNSGTLYVYQHTNAVLGASFSHDEDQIATWGQDGRVFVWRVGSTSPHLVHSDSIHILNLAWSEDDSKILFFTAFNRAFIYDLSTNPSTVTTLNHGSQQTLTAANWNEDENMVVTTAFDGSARLWDLHAVPDEHVIQHENFVNGARWSNDFRYVLTWSRDSTARISDTQHEVADVVLQHNAAVGGAQWNSDESKVLSYTWQGTVYLWDLSTGQNQSIAHETTVLGAVFSPDESQILSWTQGGSVILWTPSTNQQLRFDYTQPMRGGSFNANGSQFMVWSADGAVDVRDISGTMLVSLPHEGAVGGASWVMGEMGIVSWTLEGEIFHWDLQGNLLYQVGHDAPIKGLIWNTAATQMLSWANDGSLRLWNVDDGAVIASYDYPNPLGGAIWNKAEDRIIFWQEASGASGRGYAYLWNPESNEIIASFVHPDNPIRGVVWSPDESKVATWSFDNTVRVWTLDNSEVTLVLSHQGRPLANVFENGIWQASWDATGSRLLTVPSDGTARLWIVDIPQFIQFMREHTIRGFLGVEAALAFAGDETTSNESSVAQIVIPEGGATYIPVLLEGTVVPTPAPYIMVAGLPSASDFRLNSAASLYSGDTSKFPVVAELAPNTTISLIAQRKGWIYVQVGEVYGWLNESVISTDSNEALMGETGSETTTSEPVRLPNANSLNIPDCEVPELLFADTWAQNHWRLGCAEDSPIQVNSTAQPYLYGIMTWRSDTRNIFVLLYDGRWAAYEDTYNPRDELTCSSYYTALGFGKIYCSHPEVQALLGAPMNGERGSTLTVQNFEHGQIIESVAVGRLVLTEDNRLNFGE